MDALVLGLAALSAAGFLAFALWLRSSPIGQLEVVPAADDSPAPAFGRTAAQHPSPLSTTRQRPMATPHW